MSFLTRFVCAAAMAALFAVSAQATVVDFSDNPGHSGTSAQTFFDFGGYAIDTDLPANDGNRHARFTLPTTGTGASGAGVVWDIPLADYGALTAGTSVVRFSMWMANDVADPLQNEGTWTESIKFELRDCSGGEITADGGTDEGGSPVLLPNGCDLGTGVCSGSDQLGTSGDWVLVAGDHLLTAPELGAGLVDIGAVLFTGDFTGAESEQGTYYLDNLLVEVFADQAAADASPASLNNPNPGGIVPEPTSVVLVLAGLLGVATRRRS